MVMTIVMTMLDQEDAMAEREIKAGEFKARCLQLMDDVAATGDTIIVTKRGKPVATSKTSPEKASKKP